MGTRYNVSIVGGDEAGALRLQGLIDEALAELCRQMSTYDPASELSRFNASESDEWFPVSKETASVVKSALELAEASGGKYDPTIGPLANLWGFGPQGKRDGPPTDEEIAAAKELVDYRQLEARLDPPALRKLKPGVFVELSSIAPGHGADVISDLLLAEGIESSMVDIGGEVRARGLKPGGKPWRIGVERADSPIAVDTTPSDRQSSPLQRVVELRDKAVATSGDYRNFFESGGVRYSHTLDPQTGRPVTHDLATVTVLAETGRDADGLATALLALGPEAGYDWAIQRRVAALFVRRTAEDRLIEKTTPAWDALNPKDSP
jgi:thiamine biosynthesis lipoprotein